MIVNPIGEDVIPCILFQGSQESQDGSQRHSQALAPHSIIEDCHHAITKGHIFFIERYRIIEERHNNIRKGRIFSVGRHYILTK